MIRRWGALVAKLALIGVLIWLPAARSQAQGGASPVASPSAGLSFSGATVQTLASGTADQLPGSAPLTLERIILAPGSTTGMRQIPAPELLVVESGSLTVADSLGLSSTMTSGQQQLVPANASYEARNDSTSAVSFLRLRLGEAQSVASQATAIPGTPVAGTPAAQPAVAVLFKGKDDDLPSSSGVFFIAQASFDAGADSGNQTSSGPVGIAVTEGTLSVGTTAGIQGQLLAGKGIVLPSGTVYRLRNQSGGEVQALISGVVAANGPAAQPVIPTSTPTLVPTATPNPTNTPEPTQTPVPTSTPLPVATIHPTPTPTQAPSANVLFEVDASSGLGQIAFSGGWKYFQGMLVNDGSGGGITLPYQPPTADYAVEVEAQFAKGSYRNMTLSIRDGTVSETVNNYASTSLYIGTSQVDNGGPRTSVDTGTWHTYRLEVNGNQMLSSVDGALVVSNTDNRLINDGPGGQISLTAQDGLQINVRSFKVIAVGSASSGPTPTGTASASTSGGVAKGGVSSGAITAAGSTRSNPAHIADMLPSQGDVPSGLVQTVNTTRSLEELAQNYTNPSDTIAKFTNWGWKGNVVRDFGLPDGASAPPGGVSAIHVSIHRLGSAAGAAAALDYSVTDQATSTGVPEVTAPSLGDKTRALAGQTDQGKEITLYIERADVLVRLTVDSPDADPTNAAVEVATAILAK